MFVKARISLRVFVKVYVMEPRSAPVKQFIIVRDAVKVYGVGMYSTNRFPLGLPGLLSGRTSKCEHLRNSWSVSFAIPVRTE